MADIRQTTTYLYDFTIEAIEDPLSGGGRWARTDSVWVSGLRNASTVGGIYATESTANSYGGSYWIPDAWDGNDAEFWGEIDGGNAAGIFWGIGLVKDAGGSNAVDGYEAQLRTVSGGQSFFLYKATNGSYSQVATVAAGYSGAIGTVLWLIRRNGNDVEFWDSLDGGANWTMQLSFTDTSYTTGLHGSISVSDNSHSYINGWAAVGGGKLIRRQQIYRILQGQYAPIPA